jgi:hypothetical protein
MNSTARTGARRLVCLTGALFILGGAALPAAAAESLQVGYSIRLLGLSMGTAGLNATVSPTAYDMELSAQLSGIASIVTKAQGGAKSSGSIDRGRVLARAYATASSNSRETRTVRMALNSGSVRSVEVIPPPEPHPDRVPVTESHKRGVVDPLSAIFMPVGGRGELIGPAACDRTIPVFDGYARFDVTLSYAGTQQVRSPAYSGPVAVCKARYKAIAGHRDRKQTRYMENNRQMEVWLMPVESARVVTPYRITVATQIGQVVIEATRVSVASAPGAASRSASR